MSKQYETSASLALSPAEAQLKQELGGFEALERFAPVALLETFQQMGVFHNAGERYFRPDLAQRLGFIPKYYRLYEALLAIVEQAGYISLAADELKTTPKVAEAETRQALQSLAQQRDAHQQAYPMLIPHFNFLKVCLQALPEIVQGQVLATDIVFPNGSMELVAGVYKGAALSDYFSRLVALGVKRYVEQRLPTLSSGEKIRIVEVGAGTGGTTAFVLEALAPYGASIDYLYTDISRVFTGYGQRHFAARYPFVRFSLLDIEQHPGRQGYDLNTAELVLGTNVVHTTKEMQRTLPNLKALLKAEGLLMLNEATQFSAFATLTFGLLEGWGAFEDEEKRIKHSPLLSQNQWQQALAEAGFVHLNFFRLPQLFTAYHQVQCVIVAQSDGLVITENNQESAGLPQNRQQAQSDPIRPPSPQLNATPDAFPKPALERNGSFFKEQVQPTPTTAPANGAKSEAKAWNSKEKVAEIEKIILAQMAGLLKLAPERIELDGSFTGYGVDSIVGIDLINRISQALGLQLRTTALFDYPDIQTLARHLVKTYGEQIRPQELSTAALNKMPTPAEAAVEPQPTLKPERQPAIQGNGPYPEPQGIENISNLAKREVQAVVLHQPGTPESLQLSAIHLPPPQAQQLQIAVKAFALNFADLLCLKGLYPTMPPYPFVPGFEVTGIVQQVGPAVTDFAPGDEVVALTTGTLGGQATLVNAQAELTIKKPANLSFETACAFPIVFLTAYTAFEKAGLVAGEKVLIQTAAGGVGLMAVQLAQRLGAEIFATASSAEKCAYLKGREVDHVINYRQEDFEEVIRRETGGYGVDVVLNTLSGDYIQKGLDSLAPGGRYIEIAMTGLKSATSVNLTHLVNNQSLHSLDLGRLVAKQPRQVRAYLEQMRQVMAAGEITATVGRVFPLAEIAQAYHYLDNRQNIGKVVVSCAGPDRFLQSVASSATPAEPAALEPERQVSGWQDIAIIGMSGAFPRAKTVEEFWENLAQGRSAIIETPPERWSVADYYDPNPSSPNKTYCKWGGFLSDIDLFDPKFFKLSGREAELMDPQQRLFLEACWSALEDAGYARSEIEGRPYGVFLGGGNSDYSLKMMRSELPVEAHAFMGNDASICAARIAYLLNLKGPSLAINTACSSSLVAIHLACQSLGQGESEVALAGGVFIATTPDFHILSSKASMLSPEGKCKTFDDTADGFVPGEGVGVVVLKPLARAVADGDHIYGVIKGSGLNQDGKTNGITAPSTLSQTQLETTVYERSRVNPETISYVECHGTGTKLGDPIEIEALTNAFCAYTGKKQFCAIGSVKSNIGHAAMAAGVASVIKVLLALKHRQLPPSLHFEIPNEHIDFQNSPFYVNTELKPWAVEAGPRRAAISSFGFSGTNAHLIIEEYLGQTGSEPGRRGSEFGVQSSELTHRVDPGESSELKTQNSESYLIVLSARNEERLRVYAQQLIDFVKAEPEISLARLAYTLQVGREPMENRLAFLAEDKQAVSRKLAAFVAGKALGGEGYQGQVKRKSETVTLFTLDDDIEQALNQWLLKGKLGKLAELWVNGVDINWRLLYGKQQPGRISLPTYPFARERYWLPEPAANNTAVEAEATNGAVPEPLPVVPAQALTGVIYTTPHWQAKSLVESSQGLDTPPTLLIIAGRAPDMLEGVEVVTLPALGADIAGSIGGWVQTVWQQLKTRLEAKIPQQALLVLPETEHSYVYAPLVGLLKTALLEHPKFQAKTIWLSELEMSNQIRLSALLQKELTANSFEAVEVRYTEGGLREVKGWLEFEPPPGDRSIWLRPGGVYWITGGAGGLGRIFAEYLLKAGEAVKVILSGRSALNEADRQQLADLSSKGGNIEYLQADVSQKAAVEQALAQIKTKYGALNGLIHAAGIIRDSFILKKTEAEIEAVLAPKVAGTLNLEAVTAAEPLDFMVLFASVTGIKGNVGQADYAAANAFLDGFALYRQGLVARGQRSGRTVAISWPLWQAGGMQVAAPTLKLLAGQGIAPLATEAGLKAFEAIMAAEASQVVVAAGELDKLRARGLGFALARPAPAAGPSLLDTGLLRQKVQSELKTLVAGLLKIKRQDVAGDEEWGEYGFDSLTLTELANRLNESYSLELTPPLLYEYNTLEALSGYLVEHYNDRLSQHYQLEPAVELAKVEPKLAPRGLANPRIEPGQAENKAAPHESIAIVGISGILPGSPDLETFWRHLEAGQSLITEIPPERWDWRDHYGDPQQNIGKTRSKWGGFIPDVDKFDPLFFKISPKEAQMMDPQHRLFLQCAWHCLEDAGYRPSALAGRPVGVFVGVQFQDYQELLTRSNLEINPQIGTGNSHALLANRLSYLLDWRGPSEAIDTACSSSLVAIHRAVRAIRSGEIESALAGGVSLTLSPSTYVVTAQMGVLSPEGKCRTFDKTANGYVKGEGVGAVFLKPLPQAEADGDQIYGLIRGSAENHGGRATSLTAPNPKAQADLLVAAYQDAEIEAETVTYIETHGTGTVLGDPIEIEGLKQAFARLSEGQKRRRSHYCGLGSVKTNIGHLEPAAGIAGLLKVLLALKHQTLPATLNFTEQNPYIDLKETPFYLVTETQPWQPLRDEAGKPLPRRAGLSSFGFGGANAHLVLEEYLDECSEFRVQGSGLTQNSEPCLVALSARNEERLREYARKLLEFVTPPPMKGEAGGGLLLQTELVGLIAQLIGVKPEEIELEQPFEEYGLDPVQLSRLSEKIQEKYGWELPLPVFSGQAALTTIAQALEKNLGTLPTPDTGGRVDVSLAELAYTLQAGREAMEARLALVAADMADLRAKLASYLTHPNDLDTKGIYRGHLQAQTDRLELLAEGEEARVFIESLIQRGKLAKLAQLWVSGVELDWSLLYGEEKPRRVSLPLYPFEKKRYWLPETAQPEKTVMELRTLRYTSVTQDAEFHEGLTASQPSPTVMPSAELQPLPEPMSQPSQLLFVAETWLEQALPAQPANWVELLGRQAGKRLLVIYEAETDYQAMRHLLENIEAVWQETPQATPLNYEFIQAAQLEMAGFANWLQGLKQENRLPQVIFYLAAPAQDDRAELRFFFHLSQGLLREAGENSIQGYYLFEADASAPRLGLEALSGFTGSLALEQSNHRYRTIRVDSPINASQKAICLLNEWLLDQGEGPPVPVHYQGLNRRVPVLQEREPALTQPAPAFRQGAVYLISGGLGGLGQKLGEYLSRSYHNTLVILARSPLGQRQQQQIRQIESYGGQVYYFPVDITDPQALQQTRRQVKQKVGQIDGVIHLARQVEDGLLLHKSFEGFEQVIRAKVEGTLYLDKVTQGEPLEFFVLFSSLAAYGLKGSADYAYATAFQNSFARWRQAQVEAGQRSGQTRAVCWGQWAIDRYSEAGRNQVLRQLGFELLTPEAGLPLLEQSLTQESVVVGAMAASDKDKLKRLLAIRSEAENQANPEALFEQIVTDLREGRRSRDQILEIMTAFDLNIFSDQQIEILHSLLLGQQPARASGTPVGVKLKGGTTTSPQPVTVVKVTSESSTEVKDVRALILLNLQKILSVEAQVIDPQTPFQNYGLNSITGMQLALALEKSTGLEILPRWLLEYPTVESLTRKIQALKQQG